MTLKIKKLQDKIDAATEGVNEVVKKNKEKADIVQDKCLNEFSGHIIGFMEEHKLEPFFIWKDDYRNSQESYLFYKTIKEILDFAGYILSDERHYFKDLKMLEAALEPILDAFGREKNDTYALDLDIFSTGELCFTHKTLYIIYWKVIDNSSLST